MRKFVRIIGSFTLVLLLLSLSKYSLSRFNEEPKSGTYETIIDELSPEGGFRYQVLLDNNNPSTDCMLKVFKNNEELNLKKILGFNQIKCDTNMLPTSEVGSWVSEGVISLIRHGDAGTTIFSIDLANNIVRNISLGQENRVLQAHTPDLKYLLFSGTKMDELSLLNSQLQLVKSIDIKPVMRDGYASSRTVYDYYNHKFLITAYKSLSGSSYRLKAWFVDLTDPSLKLIYTTPVITRSHPAQALLSFSPSAINKIQLGDEIIAITPPLDRGAF